MPGRREGIKDMVDVNSLCGRWAVAIGAALVMATPAQAEVSFLDHRNKLITLEAPPERCGLCQARCKAGFAAP